MGGLVREFAEFLIDYYFNCIFFSHSTPLPLFSFHQGNMRKNKIDRDDGRDVSEKIALGMMRGGGNQGKMLWGRIKG